MDYHKNAPWTAVSRERLARMVINEGVTLKAAAARLSVSAKTAAKWMGRYRQLGVAGLAGQSHPNLISRNNQVLVYDLLLISSHS